MFSKSKAPKELTIKISGEAGQGMQTIGSALAKVFKMAGCNIFANQDYMSRIRGGNNFFQLRVSEQPVHTLRKNADIVVALDKESIPLHKDNINANGIIVVDKNKFGVSGSEKGFFDVPLYELAKNTGGSDIYINTVSCGVIAGLTGLGFSHLEQVARDIFSDKTEDIINKNIAAAKAGYDFTVNNFRQDNFKMACTLPADTLLMNGNDAIALGAIKAGCKFYSAYPMTPSTSIMNVMAHYAKEFNIVVEQAEDEVAAVNMIIGASFAGARSMTATSGGGFALMVEGLSLSGMTETPVVIVDAQRPAPATGFPTRTEQADLNFLVHTGHGEFARVVYAPGTIEEAFYLTIKAFDIAEKYQIPVLILTDQHLADSVRNIAKFDLDKIKVNRHIISKEESKNILSYKRYQLNDSGISPRAVPSWITDVVYADSDEHNEEGHITEDASLRNMMVEKRFYKKMSLLNQEIEKPVGYNLEKARTVLVGFGSTYGVIKEACESLGRDFGSLHLSGVWPFPAKEVTRLLRKARKILTVENNAGAQLAGLLKREAGINVNSSILKYDGRPFDLDYLLSRLKEK